MKLVSYAQKKIIIRVNLFDKERKSVLRNEINNNNK